MQIIQFDNNAALVVSGGTEGNPRDIGATPAPKSLLSWNCAIARPHRRPNNQDITSLAVQTASVGTLGGRDHE
jgi:hypothetical protein